MMSGNKTIKKIAAGLLSFGMVFSNTAVGQRVNAKAEGDENSTAFTIEVNGQMYDPTVDQALAKIQEIRQEAKDWGLINWIGNHSDTEAQGLDTWSEEKAASYNTNIQWSAGLEKLAQQRAAESAISFSHTRPNGTQWYSLNIDGVQSFSEIIAAGWNDPTATINAINNWYGEKDYIKKNDDGSFTFNIPANRSVGHYITLISPNTHYIGIAAFKPDSGSSGWTYAAGESDNGSYDATHYGAIGSTAGGYGNIKKEVQISTSDTGINVSKVEIINALDTNQLSQNDAIDLKAQAKIQYTNNGTTTYTKTEVKSGTQWSSSNINVATVSSDGTVTAVGNGTADITVTVGSVSSEPYSVVVKGITSVDNPDAQTVNSGTAPTLPITVKATWSDDSTTDEPVTWETIPDTYKNRSASDFTVNGTLANYPSQTVTLSVHVNAATITSAQDTVSVNTASGKEPELPENAEVKWSNGNTTNPAVTWTKNYTREQYSTRDASTFTVNGSYTDENNGSHSITATVNVSSAELTNVSNPSEISIYSNDNVSTLTSKLPKTLSAEYSNGDKDIPVTVAWDTSSITTDTYAGLGGKSFAISGTVNGWNKAITQTVNVADPELESISWKDGSPHKTTYVVGQNFAYDNDFIIAHYNAGDNKDKEIALSDNAVTVTGFDSSNAKTNTITVTYGEKSITSDLKIIAKAVTSVSFNTSNIIKSVKEGKNLDITGGTFTLTYNDGTTDAPVGMTSSNVTVKNFNKDTIGTQNVSISYTDNGKEYTSDPFKVTVEAKKVSSITIKQAPDTNGLKEGQAVNLTGAKITVAYDNGTTAEKDITEAMLGDYDKSAGTHDITVTYTENNSSASASFSATFVKKKVQSIKVTTNPSKTEYVKTEKFDPAGTVITAEYNNDTNGTVDLKAVTFTAINSSKTGKQEITASYTDPNYSNNTVTTTIEINVVERSITSVKIAGDLQKKNYYDGDEFSFDGLSAVPTYNDGSVGDTIALDSSNASVAGFDNSKAGTNEVAITYAAANGTKGIKNASVTVALRKITGVTITSQPTKAETIEGLDVDPTGAQITVAYEGGKTKENVAVTRAMLETGYSKEVGTRNIGFTYSEEGRDSATGSLSFTFKAKSVSEITVTKQPDKKDYIITQTFDPAGAQITASYDNGTKSDPIDVTAAMVKPAKFTGTGDQKVTITYEGKSAEIPVTVTALEITDITADPATLEIKEGKTPVFDSVKLAIKYNDETQNKIIAASVADVTLDYKTTVGNNLVKVSYGGYTKDKVFTLVVLQKKITGVHIKTNPTKLGYVKGVDNAIDLAGGVITASYDNGTTSEVNINSNMLTGSYDLTTTGTYPVSVTYEGTTSDNTFTITVTDRVVKSIVITTPAAKKQFVQGQSVDPTGAAITVSYEDGGKDDVISVTSEMITADTSTIGEAVPVTVNYAGKTATYNITVIPKAIDSVVVDATGTTTAFKTEQNFTSDRLKVTAKYNDGTSEEYTLPDSHVTVTESDLSTVGEKDVTVNVKDEAGLTGTGSYKVNVSEKALSFITLTDNRSYDAVNIVQAKDNSVKLDLTGLRVTLNYDNGKADPSRDVTEADIVQNYDLTVIGEKTLTVRVNDKTDYFKINVREKTPVSVAYKNSMTDADKKQKEGLDYRWPADATATVAYDNGSEEEVKINGDSFTVSGYNSGKIGSQEVTFSYKKKTDLALKADITVEAKVLQSVALKNEKTEYTVGDEVKKDELLFVATYDNGTTEEIAGDSSSITVELKQPEKMDELSEETILNNGSETRMVTGLSYSYHGIQVSDQSYAITLKPVSYEINEGADSTHNPDDSAVFRSNAEFSKFVRLYIDGAVVDSANYDKKEGSTIITLHPDYLKTLSLGTHTLTILSKDGKAVTSFKVQEKTVPAVTPEKPASTGNSQKWTPAEEMNITLQPKGTQKKLANGTTQTSLGNGTYYDQNNVVWDGFGNKVGTLDPVTGNVKKSNTTVKRNILRHLVPNTGDEGVMRQVISLAVSLVVAAGAAIILKRH